MGLMTENKSHIEFSIDTKAATAKLEALARLAAKASEAVDAAIEIKRLNINTGDTIVLRADRHLTSEMSRRLGEYVKQAVAVEGIKVLVLDQGISMEVLSSEDHGGAGQKSSEALVS